MVWSSSPTRKTLLAGAASSSASSSWVRSRSWASSTRRLRHRPRQRSSTRSSALEQAEGSHHQVVEVDAARLGDRALVGEERGGHRAGSRVARDLRGRDPEVELEAGEGEIEPPAAAASISGNSSRRSSSRSTSGSIEMPASASSSRPSAWNVRTRTDPAGHPSGSSAASSRAVSSSAARRLKATTQTDAGSAPPSTSQATRATSVVVLPDPAGATHRTGPGGAVAAARWSGASLARRSSDRGVGRRTHRAILPATACPRPIRVPGTPVDRQK